MNAEDKQGLNLRNSQDNNETLPKYEILILLLGLSWFLLLMMDLYFGRDVSRAISFQLRDPTWMPESIGPSRALVGLHHFGDFQIWLGYAGIHNPLAEFVKYPPQSPPQLLWLFQALLGFGFQPLFGIPRVLLAFWMLSLTSWIGACRIFFADKQISKSETRMFLAVTMFSAPVFVTFDRGSLQFLVVATSLLFVHFCNKEHPIGATLFFVLAISLKPYCALLILWPLSRRLWTIAASSIGASGFVTLIALWALPGSFSVSLQSFIDAIRGHVTGEGMLYLSDSVSSPASIWKMANLLRLELLSSFIETNSETALLLIGFIVMAAITTIVSSRHVSPNFKVIALISSTQLIVPLSGLYTPLWTVALLPFLVREMSFETNKSDLLQSAINWSCGAFSVFATLSILPISGSVSVDQYTFRLTALLAPSGMTLSILSLAFFVALRSTAKDQSIHQR